MTSTAYDTTIDVRADAFTDFLGTLGTSWGPFAALGPTAGSWIGFLMLIVAVGGIVFILLGTLNGGWSGGRGRSEAAAKGREQIVQGFIAIAIVATLSFLVLPIYNALTAL